MIAQKKAKAKKGEKDLKIISKQWHRTYIYMIRKV